jgi:hypothetical protein
MSRDLTAGMQAAVVAPVVRPILMVRIENSGAEIFVWTGVGDLIYGGNTYSGVGHFGSISTIQEGSDIRASGITLQLSGIPSALIATALADIRQSKKAILYFGLLNTSTGALIADPYIIFSGLTDVPQIDETPIDAVISLSIENRLIDLEQAKDRRWTPEDQALEDPTDLGFEFVAGLQDAQVAFGS